MESPTKFQVFDFFPEHHRKHLYVNWDEFKVGSDDILLGTSGVSCCLVITLYDPNRRKGVLAHIQNLSDSPTRVKPEMIVDTLLKAINLTPDSGNLTFLEATLAGENLPTSNESSSIIKPILNKYGIPIIGEDLGKLENSNGRLVFLNCSTGLVEVYQA